MIAAAVLTLPELIAGQSLGRGDGRTSILGNNRDRSEQRTSTQEQQPDVTTPDQTTPQTTTPDEPVGPADADNARSDAAADHHARARPQARRPPPAALSAREAPRRPTHR